MQITESQTYPPHSIIAKGLSGPIHYIDSFGITIPEGREDSIDYLTTRLFLSVPGWAKVLLELRDKIVGPLGLATGDSLEPGARNMDINAVDPGIRYAPGDRAVFFSVVDRTEDEVVMGEDDKHLYFRTSLCRGEETPQGIPLHLTTLVQFHNIWGRVYFAPVKLFHRLLMVALLKNFRKSL